MNNNAETDFCSSWYKCLWSDNNWIASFNGFGSQVNTNGIISFQRQFTEFSPRRFPLNNLLPLIAPFWDDVDIRRFGNVFYRKTSNVTLLQRARVQLQELFPSSGNFTPTTLFIATWDSVAQLGGGPRVSTYKTVCLLPLCGWGLTSRPITIVVVTMLYQYKCALTVDCNQKMHYFYRQTHSRL